MNITTSFPTPIHMLTERLNNNNFYIKRDDLLPFSFGGNKARKALLFFRDFENQKSDSVVTYGASSSNHCRIIANIAAAKGIPCYIISPIESSFPTANKKMVNLFNASVINCPVKEVHKTINSTLKELRAKGLNPYFIQGGGHGNIGTQAYVNAYDEIKDWEYREKIYFDYIFHTSGTGSTQSGLICGKTMHEDEREIVGISNARKNPYGSEVVLESVNNYLLNINKKPIGIKEVTFIDDYVLDGYGSFNDEILRIIKEILKNDGVPLDATYTAKTYWGMKEYIKREKIKGKNILFIHTGGTPLFFDNLEDL